MKLHCSTRTLQNQLLRGEALEPSVLLLVRSKKNGTKEVEVCRNSFLTSDAVALEPVPDVMEHTNDRTALHVLSLQPRGDVHDAVEVERLLDLVTLEPLTKIPDRN